MGMYQRQEKQLTPSISRRHTVPSPRVNLLSRAFANMEPYIDEMEFHHILREDARSIQKNLQMVSLRMVNLQMVFL